MENTCHKATVIRLVTYSKQSQVLMVKFWCLPHLAFCWRPERRPKWRWTDKDDLGIHITELNDL